MPEIIRFDEYLYEKDAVTAAAEAYGHLASIEISQDGPCVVASMTDITEEHAHVLGDAFRNHVLYETIVRARASAGEGAF